MKVGLDISVLIASVKRVGEKYHKEAQELSKKISQEGHQGICSPLLLIELPGALASLTTMPI